MNKVSDEDIKRARKVDLGVYLLSVGEPLTKTGTRYRHKEHGSLIFTDNAYYWNSKGEHGNAIDYLTRHKGFSFVDAVKELLKGDTFENHETKVFYWDKIKLEPNMSRTIAYLNKHRGISIDIITDLIKRKLLFQQHTTNNALFPIYDEKGLIVGAELVGTLSDRRFKGMEKGSKYGYGYNVLCGEEAKYILFFEGAIDLLSFMDIERQTIKKMQGAILVSLAGLKEAIFKQSLKSFKIAPTTVLCVDNDTAGDELIKRLQDEFEGIRVYRPRPEFKDWNEQLQSVKSLKKTKENGTAKKD